MHRLPRFAVRLASSIGVAVAACNGPTTLPTNLGGLVVNVVDQAGAPLAGANVQVIDGNANLRAHGTSGSNGVVAMANSPTPELTLPVGSYRAVLTPPTGYVFANTQPGAVDFQIADSQTTTFTVHFKTVGSP